MNGLGSINFALDLSTCNDLGSLVGIISKHIKKHLFFFVKHWWCNIYVAGSYCDMQGG